MTDNSKIDSPLYFRNVQALRALAALLVLAFHTYAIEGKYFGGHAVPKVLGTFGTCGVDLFFIISGFVMTTVTRGQFGSGSGAASFLVRRVARIYPIYWFYCLIVLAVMLVMPQWVNASNGHHADILYSLLLLPPSDTLPLLLQGWTLTYEMFFYFVFAGMMAFIAERVLPLALIGWALATCVLAYWLASSQQHVLTSPMLNLAGNPLVLEFVAGCFCGLLWPLIRKAWAPVILIVGIFALAISVKLGEQVGLDTVVQWRFAYFGIPAFFIVLGAVGLEAHAYLHAPRPFCRLGDASYSLYLSHVLVISAVGRLYAHFASTHLVPLLGSLLCFVVAIVAGWVSFRVIERPMNTILKRLLQRPSAAYAA